MEITLATPTPDDAEAVCAGVRASFPELHRWMPWCGTNYASEDAARWVAEAATGHAAGTSHEFLVKTEDGQFAGTCGLNLINRAYRSANLGYWVATRHAGRGIATAAVTQLANWAYAHTDLNRLEILAAIGNVASQRVAEKVGAYREGVLRARLLIHGSFHDAAVYSITRYRGAIA